MKNDFQAVHAIEKSRYSFTCVPHELLVNSGDLLLGSNLKKPTNLAVEDELCNKDIQLALVQTFTNCLIKVLTKCSIFIGRNLFRY